MTVLTIDPSKPDLQSLQEAARVVMQGGIAVYPTETVYGIGVRFDDRQALKRLFKIKNRDQRKPVLLLLSRTGGTERQFDHPDVVFVDIDEQSLSQGLLNAVSHCESPGFDTKSDAMRRLFDEIQHRSGYVADVRRIYNESQN